MSAATKRDAERLARISEKLDPADAEWLAGRILAPWQRRAERLERRAAAIRDALEHYADLSPTAAAKALARDLARRATCRARLPGALDSVARALDDILASNAGSALGWRTIHAARVSGDGLQKTPQELANRGR